MAKIKWKAIAIVVSLVFVGFLIGMFGILTIIMIKLDDMGITLDLF